MVGSTKTQPQVAERIFLYLYIMSGCKLIPDPWYTSCLENGHCNLPGSYGSGILGLITGICYSTWIRSGIRSTRQILCMSTDQEYMNKNQRSAAISLYCARFCLIQALNWVNMKKIYLYNM